MKSKRIFTEPPLLPISNNGLEQDEKAFNKIHQRIKDGKQLLEAEKNFFCQFIPIFLPDYKLESFDCCSNYKFKMTYLFYWRDLIGQYKHFKPEITIENIEKYGIEEILKHPEKSMREVSINEAQNDLKFLADEAKKWRANLEASMNGDHLWCLSKEVKYELTQLDEHPEFKFNPYLVGTNYYRYKVMAIILQSQFIYIKTKGVIESIQESDFLFSLNGQNIKLTECAITHILCRHYAGLTKQYDTGKSFHNGDFHHEQLPLQLKDIISLIDVSGYYRNDSIKRISFKYRNVPYCIRTGKIISEQDVEYVRVQTFYPIERQDEFEQLANEYYCVTVNDDIEVYCKK